MRFIHLLYVPTMACNMRCSYCYLGDQTDQEQEYAHTPLETLAYAVDKLHASEVIPFNISLHGGEVTTLSQTDFEQLVAYVDAYYQRNRLLLKTFGATPNAPHIKTNLFGLDRHMDAIRQYRVSVSGSLDLPLSLHREYRRTKGGGDTLDKILRNVEALRQVDCRKKVSATIFHEHFLHLDEIVQDIRWLHENTCLDMNDFNFMVGFASPDAPNALTPLSEEEQLALYDRMQAEFAGTELEKGLNGAWFAEFGPTYCTNCTNCGEKFFLLERNGDLYSCVRGQGHPAFRFGNIYTDSVEDILKNAAEKIRAAHASVPFEDQCGDCRWFDLCKTGCPFVKKINGSGFSYTCKLQQRLYQRDYGETLPPENAAFDYLSIMRPEIAMRHYREPEDGPMGMPSLQSIIQKDDKLQMVYDPAAFVVRCDGTDYPLKSQILKRERDVLMIMPQTEWILYMRRDVLDCLAPWPMNNALYIMLLDGRTIVYGDEGRTKQAHVATIELHGYSLEQLPSDREGYYRVDLQDLLKPYMKLLGTESPCNLFFTTTSLRACHYQKQRDNAYYHLQAINLPFPNIEFCRISIPDQPEEDQAHGNAL